MVHAPAVEFPGTARFAVIRRLGQGGMGKVYEVLDRERNTRVALKTLSTLNADTLLLFKNEFRALQDIQHPNLVRLGELFEDSGQWFFTMELVDGVDFISYISSACPSALLESTERDAATVASLHSAATRSCPPRFAPDDSGDISDTADTSDLESTPESAQSPASAENTEPGAAAPPTLEETLRAPASALSAALAGAGRFDEARLHRALGQLAQGVYALHAAQKIHRDLKPSRVTARADRSHPFRRRGRAVGDAAGRARCGALDRSSACIA